MHARRGGAEERKEIPARRNAPWRTEVSVKPLKPHLHVNSKTLSRCSYLVQVDDSVLLKDTSGNSVEQLNKNSQVKLFSVFVLNSHALFLVPLQLMTIRKGGMNQEGAFVKQNRTAIRKHFCI